MAAPATTVSIHRTTFYVRPPTEILCAGPQWIVSNDECLVVVAGDTFAEAMTAYLRAWYDVERERMAEAVCRAIEGLS